MKRMWILALSAGLQAQAGSFVGTVTDTGGNPLTGAQVVLSTGVIAGGSLDTFTTAADGQYRFDSLATGKKNRYTLSASMTGYASASQFNLTLNAGQVDTVDFTLSNDTGTVPVPTASGNFMGMVAAASDSSPVQGAMVILSIAGGVLGNALDTTWTDAAGAYLFQDVETSARQQFSISVSAAGYEPASSTRLTLDSGQTDTVDFYLAAMVDSTSWVVTGKVTADSANGMALAGVMVEFVRRQGVELRYSGKTDANGMYSILVPNAAAAYWIYASLTGYVTGDSLYQVAGDSGAVNLVLMKDTTSVAAEHASLPRAESIRLFPNPAKGNVTFTLAGADREARLALYSVSGKKVYETVLSNGTASLDRLAAGVYTWRIRGNGLAPKSGRLLIIR